MTKHIAGLLTAAAFLAGPASAADALKPEAIKTVMESYIAAFNAKDPAAVAALYDEQGTVEDPVGSAQRMGRQAIQAFYENVIKRSGGAKLELVTVNPSTANSGAMFFQIKLGQATINVIDVMRFNDAGKITSMNAYSTVVPAR